MAERTYINVVREWGQSIEFGDEYLRGHCSRVAEQATTLAAALKTDSLTRSTIMAAAYLHGVGRLRLPRTIQTKPGILTPGERAIVEQIPVWGADILSNLVLPWDVAPVVRWHNERIDGTGYPDGLHGDAVPLAAQIVGIANVFDAMTSRRAYRPALSPGQAIRELAQSRNRWSAHVLQAYLTQLRATYAGSLSLA